MHLPVVSMKGMLVCKDQWCDVGTAIEIFASAGASSASGLLAL